MSQVKLILRESVPSLGEAGELVSVKPGYARNYLIPQGKAIFASAGKVKELGHHKRVVEEKLARELKEFGAVRDKLKGLDLEIRARVGEEGKLFGSVTSMQVADLLAEKGFDVDRRKVALDEPIKEAGEHTVSVRLHRDLVAEITLKVVPEE